MTQKPNPLSSIKISGPIPAHLARSVIEETLRQLEAQSLLHVVTHKGAVVAPLIEDNSAETYALRMLLESEALRLSIPLLTDADLAQAEACINALESEKDYTEGGCWS